MKIKMKDEQLLDELYTARGDLLEEKALYQLRQPGGFYPSDPCPQDAGIAELDERIRILENIRGFAEIQDLLETADPRTAEERAADEWEKEYKEDTRALVLG